MPLSPRREKIWTYLLKRSAWKAFESLGDKEFHASSRWTRALALPPSRETSSSTERIPGRLLWNLFPCLLQFHSLSQFVSQIINKFLFISAGSAALSKIKEILEQPKEIPEFLATSLPGQSTFFICYIMLRSFTGFSLELLRIVDLIIIPIRRKWFCYTLREDEAAWRPPPVAYDSVVSTLRNDFARVAFVEPCVIVLKMENDWLTPLN